MPERAREIDAPSREPHSSGTGESEPKARRHQSNHARNCDRSGFGCIGSNVSRVENEREKAETMNTRLESYWRHVVVSVFLLWSTVLHAQPTFLTNGLVAYYPFNGNANDGSGFGNDGSIHGAVLTTNRFGFKNKAYYFDGVSAYIST
jgi:hypothetical protein